MEADPKLFRFQFGTRSLSSTKPRARRTLMSRWESADSPGIRRKKSSYDYRR